MSEFFDKFAKIPVGSMVLGVQVGKNKRAEDGLHVLDQAEKDDPTNESLSICIVQNGNFATLTLKRPPRY